MTTAIAAALDRAGYKLPYERLHDVAVAAIKANADKARDWHGAARRDVERAVLKDAELLWALMERYFERAATELLNGVRNELHAEERARRGQLDRDNHTARAPASQPNAPVQEPRMGGVGPGGSSRQPVSQRPPPPAPRRSTKGMTDVVRLSLLDTFLVNGRPIGDCTPIEAIGWAGSRERDACFVRMLTDGLPPNDPIRKYHSDPAKIQALYDQAEAMKNAA